MNHHQPSCCLVSLEFQLRGDGDLNRESESHHRFTSTSSSSIDFTNSVTFEEILMVFQSTRVNGKMENDEENQHAWPAEDAPLTLLLLFNRPIVEWLWWSQQPEIQRDVPTAWGSKNGWNRHLETRKGSWGGALTLLFHKRREREREGMRLQPDLRIRPTKKLPRKDNFSCQILILHNHCLETYWWWHNRDRTSLPLILVIVAPDQSRRANYWSLFSRNMRDVMIILYDSHPLDTVFSLCQLLSYNC